MTESMNDPTTVEEVASSLGLTVRTLHHYDRIGLCVPSERSLAGYRLHTEDDPQRLQQVVVYRRLEVAEQRWGDARSRSLWRLRGSPRMHRSASTSSNPTRTTAPVLPASLWRCRSRSGREHVGSVPQSAWSIGRRMPQ